MKRNGFTLIELLIAMVVVGVGIVFIIGIWNGGAGQLEGAGGGSTMSFGINGVVESRCVDGYKFMMGQDGSARQVMNEMGHGVRCR